jgi:hypothetical protein
VPGQGGDVDDPPVSSLEHAGQHEPAEQQRADQVDLQDLLDLSRGQDVKAGLRLGRRVVDQDVDRSESGHGDIAGPQFPGQPGKLAFRAGDEQQVHAARRQGRAM